MFMLRRGEIEGRLDPYFYEPEFRQIEKNLRNGKYEVVKLRDITHFQAGFAFKSQDYVDLSSTFLLSIKHITEDGTITFGDPTFLPDEFHTEFADFQVHHNDIVIAMTGATIGKVGLFDDSVYALLNQRNGIIRSNSARCNGMYLFYFLSTEIFRTFVRRNSNGSAQPNISETDITKIAILLPPLDVQSRVVQIMQEAHATKRAKEAEARALLESIDGYVLSELGITLPKEQREMMFRVPFSRVRGGRFDAPYNRNYFMEIDNALQSGRFKVVHLHSIIEGGLKKGYLPKNEEKGGDYPVIQITSIQSDGTIETGDVLTAQNVFSPSQQLRWHDILVVVTGATIGKIGYWDYADTYWLGGDIVKFQTSEEAYPYYLYSYLRTFAAQIHLKRHITGATNGHLSPKDIENLLIPLPPLSVQERIAREAQARRERARALEREAAELLQTAKAEVERMIVGESA